MTETSFSPSAAQRARRASMHARGADGTLSPMNFEMPPPPHFGMGGGGLYFDRGRLPEVPGRDPGPGAVRFSAASVAAMAASEGQGEEVGVLPAANPTLCAGFDPFPGETKHWGLGFMHGPDARTRGSLARL